MKLFALEVDGVLTDGRAWQNADGVLRRAFSIRDAIGLRILRKAGYRIAVVTAARSVDIKGHVAGLGVDFFFDDCADKAAAWRLLQARAGLPSSAMAYMGESACDLPVISAAAFSATVPTAPAAVQACADYVARAAGGEGAVREVCQLILHHGAFVQAAKEPKRIANM